VVESVQDGHQHKESGEERLIRELVELTAKGQTEALTEAVQEKLNRVRGKGLTKRLLQIGQETAPC
jgi:hypothetical protein